MAFVWNDLIERARVYVDDDHDEDEGWIPTPKWMNFGNVEYRRLFRQWVRTGLITPAHTVTSFTGSTLVIDDVLCIIGVAENLGSTTPPRVLMPGDQRWDEATVGKSQEWTATGSSDTATIKLHPVDSAGSYIVRYIKRPTWVTDSSTSVDLPDNGDERLVLGMSRRALIKESATSRRIDQEILDADAELNLTAWGRKDGEAPLVKRVPSRSTPRLWPVEPMRWIYFP